MDQSELRDWQGFLGDVLIELVQLGGATVFDPDTNRAMTQMQIFAACRSGGSLRICVLPVQAAQSLLAMQQQVMCFRNGDYTLADLLVALKSGWNCLDGLAADWLDEFYSQLIALVELVEQSEEEWQAVAVAEECEQTLEQIETLLATAWADGG